MRTRTYLLLLFFLGFLVYSSALFNNFVGDDDLQIVRNTQVHSIINFPNFFTSGTYETAGDTQTVGLFYRPLMTTVYSLLYTFFGPNPFAFHLFQILLQITNAVLLYYFLKYFLAEVTSFFCSLFFLIHPINVEAAVHSANLQEMLFFFFGMAALLLLQRVKENKNIISVLLLLLFSLLSKETGILFLAVSGVYYKMFGKNKRRFSFLVFGSIIILIIYVIFRYGLAHMYLATTSIAPITHAPLLQRLTNIPAILFYYLKIFFFPMDMAAVQFWMIRTISFRNFFIPLFFDAWFFVVFYSGFLWIKRKRRVYTKTYLFFSIWFMLGIILHVQILPLDATVADRWFYFPFVGIIGMSGILIQELKITKKYVKLTVTILILILCFLSILSFLRVLQWRDELTLYSHDIHTAPGNFIIDNEYASALIKNDQFEEAKKYLSESIKEYPYSANLNNMAIVYASERNINMADQYFQKAILRSDNFSIYENYANFLLYYKNPASAILFTKQALVKFPVSPGLWLSLGKAEYIEGATQAAITAVKKSYIIQPNAMTESTYKRMEQSIQLPKLKL